MTDLSRPLATLLAWADRMAQHADDTGERPLWAEIARQVREYGEAPCETPPESGAELALTWDNGDISGPRESANSGDLAGTYEGGPTA